MATEGGVLTPLEEVIDGRILFLLIEQGPSVNLVGAVWHIDLKAGDLSKEGKR